MEKREQILAAVESRMKTIAVAAGYRTDAGQNVELRPLGGLGSIKEPAIDIIPRRSPASVAAGGVHMHELNVDLQAVAQGETAETDAAAAAADILQAVGSDTLWGGLARGTRLEATEDQAFVANRSTAAVTVSLVIEYESPIWTF